MAWKGTSLLLYVRGEVQSSGASTGLEARNSWVLTQALLAFSVVLGHLSSASVSPSKMGGLILVSLSLRLLRGWLVHVHRALGELAVLIVIMSEQKDLSTEQ